MTQILALTVIIMGVIGMILSNVSIRKLNSYSIEPLSHLEKIKELYQQKVLEIAYEGAQGRITDYHQKTLELEALHHEIQDAWKAYKSSKLTGIEKDLFPEAERFASLSERSLETLIQLMKTKNLMGIIAWTTDDAPYTINELIDVVNGLMAIQIHNAKEIYSTTQMNFISLLIAIILISIVSMYLVTKMLRRVEVDLTQPMEKLLSQAEALAKQKLDEPFIWKRKDEIGKVGHGFEISRQALNESFMQIQLSNKQMLMNARQAQMGELISMIAHQWRQPLGAIASTIVSLKMKLEMAELDQYHDQELKNVEDYLNEKLDNVEHYVQSLTTTIDDFRNFYRPDKKLTKTSLQEITLKALKIIRNSLEVSNIELHEEYGDQEYYEFHDGEMMQVVLNILKNALDNFKDKGIASPKISIKIDRKIMVICDNGGGIPDDIIDKIFDPYFSTKNQKNGTGLGLYMSKTIVEEHHGGKLLVENIDNGVCFKIILGD